MRKCTHVPTPGFKSCDHCRTISRRKRKNNYDNNKNFKVKTMERSKKWLDKSPWVKLGNNCRKRAKELNLEYSLTNKYLHELYVSVGDICPVLKIPLSTNSSLNNKPSVDRIKPSLGYVKGNVRIISYRANLLKNNATIEEMELILKDLISLGQRT